MRIKTKMKGFAITMMAAFSMLNVSCDPNGGGGTNGDFTPSDALKQALAEDFPGATDVQWTEYDVYAVASFYNTVVVEQASKASSGTAGLSFRSGPGLCDAQECQIPDSVQFQLCLFPGLYVRYPAVRNRAQILGKA